MPDVLVASRGGPVVDSLRAWTDDMLGNQSSVVVSLDELVTKWSPARQTKLTKRDAVSLMSLLSKLGVGVEPDVRFGAPVPKPGSNAVLFRLPDRAAASPSSGYTAAMSLVHLTAVVAAADGTISPEEQQHLSEHVERSCGLALDERVRLEAHLAYLGSGRLGMAGMKRKVEALRSGDRAAVGAFLVGIAGADGIITPEEIITLTKVFGYLGLDDSDVYRQIHAVGIGDGGPVTVREAEETTRWSIPRPAEDTPRVSSPMNLDPEKVAARLAETAHVTALLTEIFADDDAPSGVGAGTDAETRLMEASGSEPDGTPAGRPRVVGLDGPHSALAMTIAEHSEWTRTDLEDIAGSLGLPLLDGALDVINEAALDACDEPLIEGDDPLDVNPYAVEALL